MIRLDPRWALPRTGPDPEPDLDQTPEPYRVELPLPPTDNHCHTTARNPVTGKPIRRATNDYLIWIRQAAILVRHARRRPMDTSHWWHVQIDLFLPARHGDAQNYIKPLLDILSGAVVVDDSIRHTDTGLWDDDRRVAALALRLNAVGCHPTAGHAIVTATPTAPPAAIPKDPGTKLPALRGRR